LFEIQAKCYLFVIDITVFLSATIRIRCYFDVICDDCGIEILFG